MVRLLYKVIVSIIGFSLVLSPLFFTAPALAADSYTLDIVSPADGSAVSSPDFNLVISWTKPSSQWAAEVSVKIRLISADSSSPDVAPWYNEILDISSPSYQQDSVTFNWNQYFATGWSNLGGKTPAGEYEISATLKHFGDVFVTARTTFYYKPPSLIQYFNVAPARIKAGEPITLSWQVNDAVAVSIDNGIGDVSMEGSTQIIVTDIEDPEPGKDYLARFTLTAESDSVFTEEEASVIVIIDPLPFDEIFAAYQSWGNSFHKWADGSSDATPLVGPTASGVRTNFLGGVTGLVGYDGYTRYGCQAMQYKTLVFLNEMKAVGKLIGWNYMPVRKIFSGTESIDYFQHNAVSLSRVGTDWKSGYILDSHPQQKPAHFRADSGWRNDWADLVTAYGRVYPGLSGGSAGGTGKYNLKNFNDSVTDYFKRRTPWGVKVTTIDIKISGPEDSPTVDIAIDCPVDVLVTNSAGKRLGKLADGTIMSEFLPVSAYYSDEESGGQQWYFSLPGDKYNVTITGTASGTFDLYTYTGGDNLNAYEGSQVSLGQQATISLERDSVSELTLADGTRVIPTTKAISSFMPDFTPAPTTSPDNGPTTSPPNSPATSPAYPENKNLDSSSNIGLIITVIIGIIVLLIIVSIFLRKKR
jgi:hypothetical protein